ncbi:MAG TPA: hypothetical protein VF459_09595 [Caulobacteraceae bacterium]
MEDRDDTARLMHWQISGEIPDGYLDAMTQHPLFSVAARRLAAGMLAAAESDRALDSMVKDAGRFAAATWALQLHATGGLTLPRLKRLCAASGLLSPGRARAVLLLLQYLGYVRPTQGRARNEPARYDPTPALLQAYRIHVRHALEACRILEPWVDIVLARLDEPGVVETFAKLQGEGLLIAVVATDLNSPFIRIVGQRHGGMQILHWIIQSVEDDGAFPPSRSAPASATAVARRLRVSRAHVKRLFSDGMREGLLSQAEDGSILLPPATRQVVEAVYATRLIGFLVCAAKTAVEMQAAWQAPASAALV